MKFKSAILTISDYNNYGNRLQNYALEMLLKQYGETTTIYSCINNASAEKTLIYFLKKMIKRIYSLAFSDDRSLKYVRNRKIREMSNRLIPDDSFIFSMKRGLIHKKKDIFDSLVIGSDQVWNYKWLSNQGLALRLGSFALDNHPVISYAASF